ncbi:MAG: SAM-dependent methyltransferase, partial [Gammaproteobacteria bacterium]|nr:SAM-dependent methyltransferase [Gammaproteobacteria bacterium]
VLISLVLIVLPLWKRMRTNSVHRGRMVGYFASLGFAFFFIEIAFIQKFLLFLHHPVLAVAVVLSGFLVFAGLGSYLAGRWQTNQDAHHLVVMAVITIGVLGVLYALVLPNLVFEPLTAAPMSVKLAVSLMLIGLLAIPMGMPFPLGLARLGERAKKQIPSAWAVNGCASVISAVLATVIAIHFGFTVVVSLAVVLYFLAAGLFKF